MCDCEPATFHSKTERRAAKTHQCCECGFSIMPGETYIHEYAVYEGRGTTFKTCSRCDAVRTWFYQQVPDLCLAIYELASTLNEHVLDGMSLNDPAHPAESGWAAGLVMVVRLKKAA